MKDWVQTLLEGLDRDLDEQVKQRILEKCGSSCPFSHMPDEKMLELRKQAKNEQDFLDTLCKTWRLRKENGHYFVVFDQCYCPLVNNDLDTASKTMCYCTLGSLKHKFRLTLQRDIEVVMLKTVLRGDDECKFGISTKQETSTV